ncbi:hypothetical protein BH23CHL5_BH23CHL5_13600 [soil metagenome]
MNRIVHRLLAGVLIAALFMGAAGFAWQSVSAFDDGDSVVVFDGALNLRQNPGIGGLILQVLPNGTPLTVTGPSQLVDAITWVPATTEALVAGWVAEQFIMDAPVAGGFVAGDVVEVASGPLNLRSAAGTLAAILQTLATGTTATVLAGPTAANGYDWYQLQLTGGTTGWAAGSFLEIADEAPIGGDFTTGDDIYVSDGPVNLRNAAGTGAIVLAVLPTGTTGSVLAGPTSANGYDWYQIQVTGGQAGWVADAFIALDNNGPVIVPGQFPISSYVFVNVPSLNQRSIASTDGAVLQTLSEGAVAQILSAPVSANGYTWYQVSAGGTNGYVVGEFLVGGVTVGAQAMVTDGPVNLRLQATTSSASLGALQTGDLVTVTSGPVAGGDYVWFGVTANGQAGFVAGRYLGPSS